MQISDVEQIMGLMNTETVQIHAEAYDVAMDVSYPRGKQPHSAARCEGLTGLVSCRGRRGSGLPVLPGV